MERQSNDEHLERDEEDGGFTMEFRIGVVEDIEAQVEEMMRLGALGYFKEARQLSQSIAPAHQQTFEVVFEQLRLMLDQGAYTDLIDRAESHPKNVCTPEQSDLIALMVAIAHVSISDVGQTHPSEALSQFQHVGLLIAQLQHRLSDGQWTTQELLKDVLLLRLWYIQQLQQPQDMTSIDDDTHACLVNVAFSLLEHEQFWPAKILFQTFCFHGVLDSPVLRSPTRWSNLLERVQMTDETTFERRLTKITLAQMTLELFAVHTYINFDRASIMIITPETEMIRTRGVRLQTTLKLRYGDDNYGPRHDLRHAFTVLLDSLPGAKPVVPWIIGRIRVLQTKADYYGDRGMSRVLKSFESCTRLESQQTKVVNEHIFNERRVEGLRLSGNVKRPEGGSKRWPSRDVRPRETNEDIVRFQTFRRTARTPFLERF
ncbi:hypothetical protein KC363_g8141 [Hortaea werneckii]|nr:hypothetical protein KC363_g8141 [Hortaea werneckii]